MKLTSAEKERIISAIESVEHGRVIVEIHRDRNRLRILREEGELLRDGDPVDAKSRTT